MAIVANIKGPSGANGSTWYTTSGVPPNSLGNNGDLYLDSSTSNFYNKQSGIWVFEGQLAVQVNNIIPFTIASDINITANCYLAYHNPIIGVNINIALGGEFFIF